MTPEWKQLINAEPPHMTRVLVIRKHAPDQQAPGTLMLDTNTKQWKYMSTGEHIHVLCKATLNDWWHPVPELPKELR